MAHFVYNATSNIKGNNLIDFENVLILFSFHVTLHNINKVRFAFMTKIVKIVLHFLCFFFLFFFQ